MFELSLVRCSGSAMGSCKVIEDLEGAEALGRPSPNKKRDPRVLTTRGSRKAAASYSHTWYSTTIGSRVFNFSVRDGKRWVHTDITTAVYFLREIPRLEVRLSGKISGY